MGKEPERQQAELELDDATKKLEKTMEPIEAAEAIYDELSNEDIDRGDGECQTTLDKWIGAKQTHLFFQYGMT